MNIKNKFRCGLIIQNFKRENVTNPHIWYKVLTLLTLVVTLLIFQLHFLLRYLTCMQRINTEKNINCKLKLQNKV